MQIKKTGPVITYTEILVRAIHSIEKEIEEWEYKCKAFPEAQAGAILERSTVDLLKKLDALKAMYRIETGTEYV